MKVVHRIGINPTDVQRNVLSKLGIEIHSVSGFTTIEIEENSSEYQFLRSYISQWGLMDAVGVIFTEEELNAAKLLAVRDTWSNGYPMPDDNGGYKKSTYDDTYYCTECGIGLVQKEPFRLKKEPNWGNRRIFALGWVYDELFVKKDLYEEVFKERGIEALPVLLYKKETVIADVVQLVIPTIDVLLELDNYNYEICKRCGRKKYNLIANGMLPPFKQEVVGKHLFKSEEYFGSGASARKYILFSNEIRKELLKNKAKVNFVPVNS